MKKENLSNDLKRFDTKLGLILKGKKRGIVQLKDLSYFKKIKSKIEHYPILNEIFKVRTSRNYAKTYKLSNSKHSFTERKILTHNSPPLKLPLFKKERSSQLKKISLFDVKESMKNSMDKTREIYSMISKLKIAAINSSVSKNLMHVFIKSLYFILFGSVETHFMYRDKKNGKKNFTLMDKNNQKVSSNVLMA